MRNNTFTEALATMLLGVICVGGCVQGIAYMGEVTNARQKTYYNYYRNEYNNRYVDDGCSVSYDNEESIDTVTVDTLQTSSHSDYYY